MERQIERNQLVDFYAGTGPDDCGRSLVEILQWRDDRLEWTHDYIQWLFPLRERSAFNASGPVLDDQSIAQFRSRPELQARLHEALLRMLRFYGLKLEKDKVERSHDFEERAGVWLTPNNHNHLRLTRILKSLKLLGLEWQAQALFECLTGIYQEEERSGQGRISKRTYEFWSERLR